MVTVPLLQKPTKKLDGRQQIIIWKQKWPLKQVKKVYLMIKYLLKQFMLIATKEQVVAMLCMEQEALELSFDRACPFNSKVSIVNVIKKAAPHEKLIIGPDVTIVQLAIHIRPAP